MARAVQPDSPISATGTRIQMRPMEITDSRILSDWYGQIEDVSIFDRQVPLPVNSAEVAHIVETIVADQKQEKCLWFIAEDKQGNGVGMSGLEHINQQQGNAILPVFIAASWRRRGAGIRMAAMMLDIAFHQLRLHRVGTVFRADNQSSEGLVDRLGFTLEGLSREAWYYQGHFYNLVNAGILAPEWNRRREALRDSLGPGLSVALGARASESWVWP